jgi:hypothetical protein
MKKLAIYGSVLFLGLSPTTLVRAQGTVSATFCADLQTIVSDASNHFDKFRGAQIGESRKDSMGWNYTKFTASSVIRGATICTVNHTLPPSGNMLKSYGCEWKPEGSKISTVTALARAADKCFGSDPSNYLTVSKAPKDEATSAIYGDDFEISIGAGTAPQVFITIRRE